MQASTPSLKRSITIASLIMMTSVLLSRVMGLVREQVLAHFFGTSVSYDAYVTSFLLPEFINHLLAGGFLAITFIPIFQHYYLKNEHQRAWEVFSNLLTIGTAVMAVLIALSLAAAQPIINHLTADPVKRALTLSMTYIILPAQVFFYWGAFLIAVQYARGRFFLPALLPLFYNAGIIGCGIVLQRSCGIKGFAWGVVAGAFLGNVAVQLPGALRMGLRYRPRFDLRDPDVKHYVFLTVPLIFGLGMSFSNEIFFRIFGSMLGTGVTAILNYPLRTMMILVAVFGQASGVASYPFLSRMAVETRYADMNRLLNTILIKMGAILIPVSMVMMALARPILALLFQHGSFKAAATAAAAPVLVMYLVGAYAFAANALIVRNFYACRNTLFPMLVSTIAAICVIPLYWLGGKWYGARGIALTSSLFMIAQTIVLYGSWSARHANVAGLINVVKKIALTIAVSLPGAAVCCEIQKWVPVYGNHLPVLYAPALVIFAAGIPAMITTVFLLQAAKIMRLGDWIRIFKK
ncbi:MAG: murein biosynthesis integral membrane protein MurJ [Chitinivibrionales bacterium]|nr:murein biosynthesis integral membrane protein MurJ [Chitinivibrionales bacterium]